MRIAVIIVRILMGLMFLNASLGYFFHWYDNQPKPPAEVITYMNGIGTVHLMEIIKSIELLCAICFLAGRYVALAAVALFPITFNILLLHAMINPATVAIAIAIFVAHIFLLYAYRKNYAGLFRARRIE